MFELKSKPPICNPKLNQAGCFEYFFCQYSDLLSSLMNSGWWSRRSFRWAMHGLTILLFEIPNISGYLMDYSQHILFFLTKNPVTTDFMKLVIFMKQFAFASFWDALKIREILDIVTTDDWPWFQWPLLIAIYWKLAL